MFEILNVRNGYIEVQRVMSMLEIMSIKMPTFSISSLYHHPVKKRSLVGVHVPNILQEFDLSRRTTIVGPNTPLDLRD